MTGGDLEALDKLSRSVLKNRDSLETLSSILTVYPDDLLAEDIFNLVLEEIISNLKDPEVRIILSISFVRLNKIFFSFKGKG